jgi:hypothetical protein
LKALDVCPNSSVVEHAAVNRGVTGSSPVWGVVERCTTGICSLYIFFIHKCGDP